MNLSMLYLIMVLTFRPVTENLTPAIVRNSTAIIILDDAR